MSTGTSFDTIVAWSISCARDEPSCREAAARFSDLPRALLLFLAIGSLGLAIDVAVFSALSQHGSPDAIGRAASLGLATAATWQLNRNFNFGWSGRSTLAESMRYALVAFVAQGFNYGLFLSLRAVLADWPSIPVLIACAVATAAFSFAGQRFFTFTRHHARCRAPV
jgi:putative flippase GtrA